MNTLEPFAGTAPPWLHSVVGNQAQSLRFRQRLSSRPHHVVRVLDGAQMRNYDGLFTEFAVKLSFPSYFGRNFNALEDSLTDLPWLRPGACVLWITEASRVLELERPDDRIALVRLLDRVCREWNRAVDEGKAWDRPAIPFHVMLEAEGAGEGVSRLLSEAGPEYSELSLT